MIALWMAPALAADLSFSNFDVAAKGDGVEVSYHLDPSIWSAVQGRSEPPKVMVTVEKPGTRYNQLVHLDEFSKTVTFGSGEWPAGASVLIELHQWGAAEFDSLVVSGSRGKYLYIPLGGGTSRLSATRPERRPLDDPPGRRPSPRPVPAAAPAPTSGGSTTRVTTSGSVSVEPVDPAAVLGSIAGALRQEQERRRREQQEALYQQQRLEADRWAREQAAIAQEERRVFIEETLSNPEHPLVLACTEVFGTGNDRRCVEATAYRDNGPAEVRACGRFDSGDTQWGCIDRLPQSTFVPEPIISACIDVFGAGPDALTCMDKARDHHSLPETDIRACGALGNVEAKLYCIPYFSAIQYDPTELIDVCLEVEPNTAFNCMNRALETGFVANPSLIRVCEDLRDNQDTYRLCHKMSRRVHGAEEARACARLEEVGRQIECMERVEEATYLPHFIVDACVDVMGAGVEAMRCYNSVLGSTTPPAFDIRSCGEGFENPRDKLACMKRFRDIEWSPDEVIGTCQQHFPDAAVACVNKVSAGAASPHVDLIGACASALDVEEDALECIGTLRREKEGVPAAAVKACASLVEGPKDVLECVSHAKGVTSPEAIAGCADQKKPLSCVKDLK